MKKYILLLFLASLGLVACKKDGTGGNNSITALPKHHNRSIPNSTVYIKYGAKEFPGENVADYDDSKIAKLEPGMDAHAHFDGLLKGDYYIYAIGYDSAVKEMVKGGIAVKIATKSGGKEVDVPMTE